ncbi:chemotaxis protein CheB [Sphingomonas abaci]|jgi:two-component system, chemotaxis family, protein-glutamate methylesterase/glutaminase|uniref:protein-glutamate methylesterase n=1 Tax=Sphingomonas abaci TaxID=237611 RepID=A0A7W7AGT2_9SPHN|nr:chemotaxis protein CheB [Sphingomonas abaci]MBB4616004.1 two-component system chemotaxis response regulator CheB [Sphingomonas abaci]
MSGMIVIGASAGGVQALLTLLPALPAQFPRPILIVLHVPPDRDHGLVTLFRARCAMHVCEAEDKQAPVPGTIYFAPANYHLLVESGGSMALSADDPVNHSRPSIDLLFETAADAMRSRLIAVLLTGANADGAMGLRAVARAGGTAIVEDPDTAQVRAMPAAGLALCPDAVRLVINTIAPYLLRLA